MLGKEVGGQYAGLYNLPGGKLEAKDQGCYLNAIKREIGEEIKLELNWQEFKRHFKHANGKIRFLMHNSTPCSSAFFLVSAESQPKVKLLWLTRPIR